MPRARAVDVSEAVGTAGVAVERHKFSIFGSPSLLETNLDEVFQSVPNQGLLSIVHKNMFAANSY